MSQTSYSVNQAAGKEGMLYDVGNKDAISCIAEEAIPFGKLVVRGTADNGAVLPAASGDVTTAQKVLGMAMFDMAKEQDANGAVAYANKDAVSVLRKGRAWVKVEEAVTPASSVYVRYAAGGNGVGSFGDTAGTSERAALAGAKYLTSASADGLALIEFNL